MLGWFYNPFSGLETRGMIWGRGEVGEVLGGEERGEVADGVHWMREE